MDGAIILLKPAGYTSFQTLYPIKKRFKGIKVGHTGTLDKFATGVLVAVLGKFTRLADYITDTEKEYTARFILGKETDTLDPEGVISKSSEIPSLNRIKKAVLKLTGTIEQVPPQYSAVHVNGVRAYKNARSGNQSVIPARPITIHSFNILKWDPPALDVKIVCSKGTYIRSLARDLGNISGSAAYVEQLSRTRVGNFYLQEAVPPEECTNKTIMSPFEILKRLKTINTVRVKPSYEEKIINGNVPYLNWFEDLSNNFPLNGLFGILDSKDRVLALAQNKNGKMSYKCVLGRSA